MKELNVLSTLENFGNRELTQVVSLLTAYNKADHLPSQWANRMVTLDFNPYSGMVYLANEEYQALVLDDETSELALWYSTPYNGLIWIATRIAMVFCTLTTNYHGIFMTLNIYILKPEKL